MQIEINDEEIDVQDIISKMKSVLGKHHIKENLNEVSLESRSDTNFSSLDIKSLYEKVDLINKSWHSNPEFLITSHRRVIGPFIIWGKKLVRKFISWYINPYATSQNEFNGNITRTFNEIFTQLKITNDQLSVKEEQLNILQSQYNKLVGSYSELQLSLQNEQSGLKSKMRDFSNSIQMLQNNLNTKVELVGEMNANNAILQTEEIEGIKTELESMKNSVDITILNTTTRVANERLRRIERKLKNSGLLNSSDESVAVSNSSNNNLLDETKGLNFDYYLFEEYFRGSREEIIQRQRQYLSYFSDSKNVLDLGCGRGEFTELLLQENINVVSVDLDDDMVEYCRDRGFNIKKMDLLKYLETIEDNSVDGIFLGQVIEHMQAKDLINMVQLAYKKLKPNSWLIAETPNPRSLSIFAQSFYLDLTHNKPVHPFTSKFIWETEGFRDVEVQYFSPNNPILQLPQLKIPTMDQEVMSKFNTGLQYWNDIIFGNQDYFVAGKK